MIERGMHRNRALLDIAHEAPCMLLLGAEGCGNHPSVPCHSDAQRHGRGAGCKSHDCFAVPGCPACHTAFTRANLGREERLDDPDERRRCLEEGEQVVETGSAAHNHVFFYREAIDAALEAQDWSAALRYAQLLERRFVNEPITFADFLVGRARALAAMGQGQRDPALRQRMGQAGRRRVLGHFQLADQIEAFDEFYHRTLSPDSWSASARFVGEQEPTVSETFQVRNIP